MAWRIEVAPRVREFFAIVEAPLREELIGHIAGIADAPVPVLRRSRPPLEPTDAWVYQYASEVVPGLRMMVFFAEVDIRAGRMVLVQVSHFMEGEEQQE